MPLTGCSSGGSAAVTLTLPYCTVVAADMSDFSYISCSICNRTLPENAEGVPCPACGLRRPFPARVYRLFLSVATHDRVFPVVVFDRAARTLLGCPADELARLFAAHPRAAARAADALQGGMFRMSLRASAKGTADHLRAVSITPLRQGFRPVIHILRTLYPRG